MTRRSFSVTCALAIAAACGGNHIKNAGQPPQAAFTATPSTVQPQVFHLDASASTVAVGRIVKYEWTFGDENGAAPTDVAAPTTIHAYAATGTYTITLLVFDDSGTESQPTTHQVTVTAIVGNSGPVAVCNVTPTQPTQGSPVTFDGTQSVSSGATITTWAWNFGDGSNGSGSTATHTYNVQATFHATLQVIDSNNKASSAASCPAVVVTAPSACVGNYSLDANPKTATCQSPNDTTWVGVQWSMTEAAGGTITATEAYGTNADGGAGTITYSGTWSGSSFNMTGTYSQTDPSSGCIIDTNATISGTFSGCASWTGTWTEDKTIRDSACLGLGGPLPLCTITWNVSGTKL